VRRRVAMVVAWSTAASLFVAPLASAQEQPRVFGRAPEARVFGKADDGKSAPSNARDARAVAPAPGPRLMMSNGVELSRLSPYDQQRYIDLGAQNRRIWFPITMIALGGTALAGVLTAFLVLSGETCPVDDGYYPPDARNANLAYYAPPGEEYCGVPPGVVIGASLPTGAAILTGAIMLHRRLGRRREYQALERKAMFAPVLSGDSVGLRMTF
jgi:hypothetical protein